MDFNGNARKPARRDQGTHRADAKGGPFRKAAAKRKRLERTLKRQRRKDKGRWVSNLLQGGILLMLAAVFWQIARLGSWMQESIPALERGWSTVTSLSGMDAAEPKPELGVEGNRAQTLKFRDHEFDTFVVHHEGNGLTFRYQNEADRPFGNIKTLREAVEKNGNKLVFATNAGIFLRDNQRSIDVPEGLFVTGGKEIVPLNEQKGSGNFYMEPNGVFAVTDKAFHVTTTAGYHELAQKERVEQATQSGPLLLIDGKINQGFNPSSKSKFTRSGVGILNEKIAIFAISRQPVTFEHFAAFFKDLYGCSQALYLDGAISQFYLPELGRTASEGNFAGMIGFVEKR